MSHICNWFCKMQTASQKPEQLLCSTVAQINKNSSSKGKMKDEDEGWTEAGLPFYFYFYFCISLTFSLLQNDSTKPFLFSKNMRYSRSMWQMGKHQFIHPLKPQLTSHIRNTQVLLYFLSLHCFSHFNLPLFCSLVLSQTLIWPRLSQSDCKYNRD